MATTGRQDLGVAPNLDRFVRFLGTAFVDDDP